MKCWCIFGTQLSPLSASLCSYPLSGRRNGLHLSPLKPIVTKDMPVRAPHVYSVFSCLFLLPIGWVCPGQLRVGAMRPLVSLALHAVLELPFKNSIPEWQSLPSRLGLKFYLHQSG